MNSIICHYLKTEKPALSKSVYPGSLGTYIQSHISYEAWALWKARQIQLINEYKLTLIIPKDKAFLKKEMLKFLEITEYFE